MTHHARTPGWRLIAIASTVAMLAVSTGTTLALWSQQVETEPLSVQAPVLGLAVTIDESTLWSDSGQAVLVSVDPAAGQVVNGVSAVAIDVDLLTSPGYAMGYTITPAEGTHGVVLYPVESLDQCVPSLAGESYTFGDPVPGITQSTGESLTDHWCALFLPSSGAYTNKASATGTNFMGDTETSSEVAPTQATPGSVWSATVFAPSGDATAELILTPVVTEEGQQ